MTSVPGTTLAESRSAVGVEAGVGVGGVVVAVGAGDSVVVSPLPEHASAPTTKKMDRNRVGASCTSLEICIFQTELYHKGVLDWLVARNRRNANVVKGRVIH